jgi:hypothetical protein
MSNRVLAYIAIGLAAVLSVGGAAGAAYFGRPAKAAVTGPPAATQPPLEDQTAQLAPRSGINAGTSLNASGGDWRTILSLTLPAGQWVLHADETAVNLGPSDWVRCEIAEDPGAALDQQSAFVGDSGGLIQRSQPATTGTDLSETAPLVLGIRTTVSLFCDHDTGSSAGAALPYIDPGAVLWAHQSGNLTPTTESLP